MPLNGIIYRPTGNSSNRPSPGILSTGLKYRHLGLSQSKIIRTSLPLTEGYAWHFRL